MADVKRERGPADARLSRGAARAWSAGNTQERGGKRRWTRGGVGDPWSLWSSLSRAGVADSWSLRSPWSRAGAGDPTSRAGVGNTARPGDPGNPWNSGGGGPEEQGERGERIEQRERERLMEDRGPRNMNEGSFSQAEDELLEDIWVALEDAEGSVAEGAFTHAADGREAEARALAARGFIEMRDDKVALTERGYRRARGLIRNHRLAERLLADVLNLDNQEIEATACHYEHMLDRGASESVCILLGHPRTCPHGKPIPEGECCKAGDTSARPLVVRLSDLDPGEEAEVAYIGTKDNARLAFLTSLGIMPGHKVRLCRRRPSYIVQVEETTAAFDDAVAREIFVRPAMRQRRHGGRGKGRGLGWLFGKGSERSG